MTGAQARDFALVVRATILVRAQIRRSRRRAWAANRRLWDERDASGGGGVGVSKNGPGPGGAIGGAPSAWGSVIPEGQMLQQNATGAGKTPTFGRLPVGG